MQKILSVIILVIVTFAFTSSALAENERQAEIYSQSCNARIELADYQGAISDCTTAINLANNPTEPLISRSIAYYRQGNYQAAIIDSDRIISLHKCDFRAYYNRALAHAGEKNYLKAIDDLNIALVQLPSMSPSLLADIYTDRGLAKFELADYQAAMQDFSLAIRLNPQNARAYYNRGCTCFLHGDYHHAVSNFTTALQLNPNNSQAYVNRGIARHQLGYQQAAIQDLQQASQSFLTQKNQPAYQKTIHCIKQIQQILVSNFEIVDA
ncbi:tetratricopeptide repeat protein [Synechocystis sp. PCC 7509]|uniref:tetratricopeptide repeat protein n=1 Tax=Synechocystis sp. PCC 7509 TaxID=927677 RepID=UPI0002ABD69B|nr:tetratricopeptide repeat protein [Synechocystis sp. PCC 7509]